MDLEWPGWPFCLNQESKKATEYIKACISRPTQTIRRHRQPLSIGYNLQEENIVKKKTSWSENSKHEVFQAQKKRKKLLKDKKEEKQREIHS